MRQSEVAETCKPIPCQCVATKEPLLPGTISLYSPYFRHLLGFAQLRGFSIDAIHEKTVMSLSTYGSKMELARLPGVWLGVGEGVCVGMCVGVKDGTAVDVWLGMREGV
jgi:hypothetical protein